MVNFREVNVDDILTLLCQLSYEYYKHSLGFDKFREIFA